MPISTQTMPIFFKPIHNGLHSVVDIDSLEQEMYKIDLQFLGVAETHHNMEQGNIYLSANFTSYLPETDMIKMNRMGTFDYKGRLQIYIKEFFQFVPFGKYILQYALGIDSTDYQSITISLHDNFLNNEFQLKQV